MRSKQQPHNPDAAHHFVPPQQEPPSAADLQAQYALVSKSLDYLGLVLAAVMLNYFTVDVQKQQLGAAIAKEEIPFAELELFPLQLSAATMILSASSFYFGVSDEAARTGSPDPAINESLSINNLINAMLVIAASARIYNLFLVQTQAAPAAQEQGDTGLATDLELEDSLPV